MGTDPISIPSIAPPKGDKKDALALPTDSFQSVTGNSGAPLSAKAVSDILLKSGMSDVQELWTFPIRMNGSDNSMKPCYGPEGTVFISNSIDNRLYCLDVHTGEKKWEQDFPGSRWVIYHKDGTVFGGGDNGIYAFDGKTGAIKWKRESDTESWECWGVDPGGTLYADIKGNAHAIDGTNGQTKWVAEREDSGIRLAVLPGERIIVSHAYDFQVLDKKTGKMTGGPFVYGPYAYRISREKILDWGGFLKELKMAKNPAVKRLKELLESPVIEEINAWTFRKPIDEELKRKIARNLERVCSQRELYSPGAFSGLQPGTQADALLKKGIHNLSDKEVEILNYKLMESLFPGKLAQPFDLDMTEQPAVNDKGVVFMGSQAATEYKVTALDGDTLSPRWEAPVEGNLMAAPVIATNGMVYVISKHDLSTKAVVHAFDGESGAQKWASGITIERAVNVVDMEINEKRGALVIRKQHKGPIVEIDVNSGKVGDKLPLKCEEIRQISVAPTGEMLAYFEKDEGEYYTLKAFKGKSVQDALASASGEREPASGSARIIDEEKFVVIDGIKLDKKYLHLLQFR